MTSGRHVVLVAEAEGFLARASAGDVAAADEAIVRLVEALAVAPADWSGRIAAAVDAGIQLRHRFRRSLSLADLDLAAALLEREYASGGREVGAALVSELALVLYTAATAPPVIDASTPADPDAGRRVAIELLTRARAIAEPALAEVSAAADRRRLAHALGLVVAELGERERAIDLLRDSAVGEQREPRLALAKLLAEGDAREQREAAALLDDLSRDHAAAAVAVAFEAARFHGFWASSRAAWAEGGAAYRRAITAREAGRARQSGPTGERGWLVGAGGVVSEAAYALARAGDANGAVAVLEDGLAANLQDRLGIESVPRDGHADAEPLLYFAVAATGAVALISAGRRIQIVLLDGVSRTANHARMLSYAAAYRDWQQMDTAATRQRWLAELVEALAWLKAAVLEPALAVVPGEAATIVSDGGLDPLPLHAAVIDAVELGYAPTASVLNHARIRARTSLCTSALAVADPGVAGYRPLAYAGLETKRVAESFGEATVLEGERARLAVVEDALPAHDVAHFACHAQARIDDVPLSAIFLAAGEELTLGRVLELDLSRTRLVILSACETALGDIVVASEKTSLASGFLAAGAAGVIATSWAVSDRSTLLLIGRFIELWRSDGLAPRAALVQAQRWLASATAREISGWTRERAAGPSAAALNRLARSFARRDPDERPYAHPHFWAAFSFHGA